ncbi:dUTP diphosphatase [Oceanobacillus sp. CAU 1775]
MNWDKLYSMQEQLDSYIHKNHQVEGQDLFNERYLALLVELGELANETRCFKFWSTKKRSADDVVLAEYVDGIHFLLSIGLAKSYRYEDTKLQPSELSETEQFNNIFLKAAFFKENPNKEKYNELFTEYLKLGQLLGFTEEAIQQAYFVKNEINFERQNSGY